MFEPYDPDRPGFRDYLALHVAGGRAVVRVLVTGCVSYFVGPFLFGAIFRPPYSGLADRLGTGAIWSFLSAVFLGVPPTGAGGGHLTTWPLILLCWIVSFFAWVFVEWRSFLRRHAQADHR